MPCPMARIALLSGDYYAREELTHTLKLAFHEIENVTVRARTLSDFLRQPVPRICWLKIRFRGREWHGAGPRSRRREQSWKYYKSTWTCLKRPLTLSTMCTQPLGQRQWRPAKPFSVHRKVISQRAMLAWLLFSVTIDGTGDCPQPQKYLRFVHSGSYR